MVHPVAIPIVLLDVTPEMREGCQQRLALDLWTIRSLLLLRIVAPRCFVWVDLGDLSPKPPGIYRFET